MGPRDEEFHTIVTELLSEWGWSVARPAVSIIDVVAEPHDREAGAIRDLLERLGFPNRILTPDSIEGAALVAAASADSRSPSCCRSRGPMTADSFQRQRRGASTSSCRPSSTPFPRGGQ